MTAQAAVTLPVNTGGASVANAIVNAGNVLVASGWAFCAAIFITGAFFYIVSMGDEGRLGFGKKMMIGSVIGAIVIAGANGIMNTVLYFLYG